jgi:NNP family nitrate/nitrite transporter-like MFS transporter
LVGLLGAVGGVLLPLAWGPLRTQFGVPQVVFAALLALTVVSAAWFAVGLGLARARRPVPVPVPA